MVDWKARELAVAMARDLHIKGMTREKASEEALRTHPEIKMSRDQLKGLAFGVTWYGFGSKAN